MLDNDMDLVDMDIGHSGHGGFFFWSTIFVTFDGIAAVICLIKDLSKMIDPGPVLFWVGNCYFDVGNFFVKEVQTVAIVQPAILLHAT